MINTIDGLKLRVFVDESDKHKGMSLYEWIVKKALEEGLSGATVFRGIAGYGAHSKIHTSKILDLSVNLPIVVEIIDEPSKVEKFLVTLDENLAEGVATVESVNVRIYRKKS